MVTSEIVSAFCTKHVQSRRLLAEMLGSDIQEYEKVFIEDESKLREIAAAAGASVKRHVFPDGGVCCTAFFENVEFVNYTKA